MKQSSSFNFKFSIIIVTFILVFFMLYHVPYTLTPTYAQVPPGCSTSTTTPRAGGLVTTPSLDSSSKFYTSGGTCIVSSQTPFVPYKIPTYDDLKSIYFDQAKPPIKKVTLTSSQTTIPTIYDQTAYYTNGDLNSNSCCVSSGPTVSGSGTAIIFVDGNLSFFDDIRYGDNLSGLIFVVKGNVYISPQTNEVQAVIISSGTIYTAGSASFPCTTRSVTTVNPLVVKGSFITLGTQPIQFCRNLSNNAQAAEQIQQQSKYLVILRNLMYQNLQKWSEVTQ